MKNVLKIWLVDNTVTVDNKDDKIGQLESSGNLSLQDILDEMHKEDTGLRPETIEHRWYREILCSIFALSPPDCRHI